MRIVQCKYCLIQVRMFSKHNITHCQRHSETKSPSSRNHTHGNSFVSCNMFSRCHLWLSIYMFVVADRIVSFRFDAGAVQPAIVPFHSTKHNAHGKRVSETADSVSPSLFFIVHSCSVIILK